MKTKVIIITGKAQSGKDSAALVIKNLLKIKGFSSKSYSMAEELKNICINLFGMEYQQCWGENKDKDTDTSFLWENLPVGSETIARLMLNSNGKKINQAMTAREVMQIWGTDIFRSFDPNCWVRSTLNKIEKEGMDFAIISDARFPNEINFAESHNPIVIKLTRDVIDNKHSSETALDDFIFSKHNHYIIDNQSMSMEFKNAEILKIINEII